jgi:glutathionylspermidine synthase
MKAVYKDIQFNFDQCVAEEVPYMAAFYGNGKAKADMQDLLSFPTKHSAQMPFYTISERAAVQVCVDFNNFYEMMIEALRLAFADEHLLYHFFDCNFLRKHGAQFVPYARATFNRKHPSIYGRFDAAYDPETDRLKGVYEFNGDTPVMLFESVNLQARYSATLGEDQCNEWWLDAMNFFEHNYKNMAVVCDTRFVEDMATSDTLAQALSAARPDRNVHFLDFAELEFDHANIYKPWVGKGSDKYYDGIFILSPWEEMIENFPAMLANWERWIDNVHLFEPAWRWFLSNKGMMALCTHLMETDEGFAARWAHVPLIPTYLTQSQLRGQRHVGKPKIGRLSNNIVIYGTDGEPESNTGGFYTGEACVYQKYVSPGKVEGRNNFIMGMWMAPGKNSFATTLCMREFDFEVLSIANERYIPHIVED